MMLLLLFLFLLSLLLFSLPLFALHGEACSVGDSGHSDASSAVLIFVVLLFPLQLPLSSLLSFPVFAS